MAAHPGAGGAPVAKPAGASAGGAGGSAEEIKVMKELVLALADVIGDAVGAKRAGEIRELAYKLSHM